MIQSGRVRRYGWRLPVYLTAILGAIVFVIGGDLIRTLIFFLGAPALALIFVFLLLGATVSKNRRSLLWMAGAIAVFFAISAALIAYQRDDPECIRSTVRWTLRSNSYKAEVLAQKAFRPGGLKHIEWDYYDSIPTGGVFMYLVYDPSDSLLSASKKGSSGAVPGIPCFVNRVHRLESHWYTVLYPEDSSWISCVQSSALIDLESR